MKFIKKLSIVSVIFLILVLLCICSAKKPEIKLPEDIDIISLGETYKLVQLYVQEHIGEDYKPFKMRAEFSDDVNKVEFIYTKRNGLFNDAYFIVVDKIKRTINSVHQTEANRLYGGETVVNVDMWSVDIEEYLDKPGYDFVIFETSYNNLIISYYLQNKLERILEINPITQEVLGEIEY